MPKKVSAAQMQLYLIDALKVRRSDDIYSNGVSQTMTLYNLLLDFNSNRIMKPAHQRDQVWTPQKQGEYIAAICTDSTPPGSIELYEVLDRNGRPGPLYINDGVQRLFTAKSLQDDPAKYGLSFEDVDYILRNTRYAVNTKKQRSHQEAVDRFLRVNSGVALTPYQLIIGKIIYCQGDERKDAWTTFTDRVVDIVSGQVRRITNDELKYKSVAAKIQLEHKFKRLCLSLFWRYLSGEKSPVFYKCDQTTIDEANVFENALANKLSEIGIDSANENLESFKRILESEAALMIDLWKKSGFAERRIKDATIKWLFDLAIYRRNNGVAVAPWADFVYKLLCVGEGKAELRFKNPKAPDKFIRVALTGGRIGAVVALSRLLESDFADAIYTRRRKREELNPGYHHSHKLPYSQYGDGETFIEPSLLNLSRGARPIDTQDRGVIDQTSPAP